jgi:3-isopropylmalate dehydrogenase
MYEPIHGSASDIAEENKANPIATILSVAMMLRYSLDENELAIKIEDAVSQVLNKSYRTADIFINGNIKLGTSQLGDEIVNI